MNEQPTQDERTMALLAHVLQIVGGFIAPLIIFVLRPKSRFVRFHAVQALLLQPFIFVCVIVLLLCGLAALAVGISSGHDFGLPEILFIGGLLAGPGSWLLIFIPAIVYGVKANRGEWAAIPIVGRWARRMLHL
jgi:uncharacterized protein